MTVETTVLTMTPGDVIGAIVVAGLLLHALKVLARLLGERFTFRRRDDRDRADTYDPDDRLAEMLEPAAANGISIDGLVKSKQYRKALRVLVAAAENDMLAAGLRDEMRQSMRGDG